MSILTTPTFTPADAEILLTQPRSFRSGDMGKLMEKGGITRLVPLEEAQKLLGEHVISRMRTARLQVMGVDPGTNLGPRGAEKPGGTPTTAEIKYLGFNYEQVSAFAQGRAFERQ